MAEERSSGVAVAGWYSLLMSAVFCVLAFGTWLWERRPGTPWKESADLDSLLFIAAFFALFSLASHGVLRLKKVGYFGLLLLHTIMLVLTSLTIVRLLGPDAQTGLSRQAAIIPVALGLASAGVLVLLLTGGARRQFFGEAARWLGKGNALPSGIVTALCGCLAASLIAMRLALPDPFKGRARSAEASATRETAPRPQAVQPARDETKIRARHILISVPHDASPEVKASARAKAESVRRALVDGQDFAALAKTFSDCPSKSAGGELGFFGRGAMVKSFETAVFALTPGEISLVIETEFGFHIAQVTDVQLPPENSADASPAPVAGASLDAGQDAAEAARIRKRIDELRQEEKALDARHEAGMKQLTKEASLGKEADALSEAGKYDEALTKYARLIQMASAHDDGSPERWDVAIRISMTYVKMGDVCWAKGEIVEARKHYQQGSDVVSRISAEAVAQGDVFKKMPELLPAMQKGLGDVKALCSRKLAQADAMIKAGGLSEAE